MRQAFNSQEERRATSACLSSCLGSFPQLALMRFRTDLHYMHLQAQYQACLASAVAFCGDPQSMHSRHLQQVMGEAMVLLILFMECLPDQFMACQSISLLDGTTRMPPEAFEELKVGGGCINFGPIVCEQCQYVR